VSRIATWRRVVDDSLGVSVGTAVEIDAEKEDAVRRVLTFGFSGHSVRRQYDSVRLVWVFRVSNELEQETVRLDLAEEWVDDHSPALIENLLRSGSIVDRLKREKKVLITNESMP